LKHLAASKEAADREARDRIDALREELRDTAHQLAEARVTVADVRGSWAWLLTAPFRRRRSGVGGSLR
jgi:hypothetical protein